jgi:hypothetical protein
MQHWTIAFCCSCVASVARVSALAVAVRLVLEVVLVVAEVLEMVVVVVVAAMVLAEEVLLRFARVLLKEMVGLGVGTSPATTSASISSKSTSA